MCSASICGRRGPPERQGAAELPRGDRCRRSSVSGRRCRRLPDHRSGNRRQLAGDLPRDAFANLRRQGGLQDHAVAGAKRQSDRHSAGAPARDLLSGPGIHGQRSPAKGKLMTSFDPIPVNRLTTRMGARYEPVTYWLTMGDQVVRTQWDKRMGPDPQRPEPRESPDGLSFRVSSTSTGIPTVCVRDEQQQFVAEHDGGDSARGAPKAERAAALTCSDAGAGSRRPPPACIRGNLLRCSGLLRRLCFALAPCGRWASSQTSARRPGPRWPCWPLPASGLRQSPSRSPMLGPLASVRRPRRRSPRTRAGAQLEPGTDPGDGVAEEPEVVLLGRDAGRPLARRRRACGSRRRRGRLTTAAVRRVVSAQGARPRLGRAHGDRGVVRAPRILNAKKFSIAFS